MIKDYVTHTEFQKGISELRNDMLTMELRLSKQLSEKIYDTYLRLIPIVLTILGLQTAVIFFVVKGVIS